MKSPCLDRGDGLPCKLVDEDKNNDECVNCKARLIYVDYLDRCLSSSMPMEITKIPRAGLMEDKKLCEKCGEKPTIHKNSKHCPSCLSALRWEKNAPKVSTPKETTIGKEKPEKARKTAYAAVVIEFGKYVSVLNEVEKLADEEMRPVDIQIIYILKKHFENIRRENAI